MLRWWRDDGKDHIYYRRVRKFLQEVGLESTIIWTELVKWDLKKNDMLSHQTLRDHIAIFLKNEIEEIGNKTWPLIGLGKKSFEALAYCFPGRTVIGLPHPTGRFASRKFKSLGKSKENLKKIRNLIKDSKPNAVWFAK